MTVTFRPHRVAMFSGSEVRTVTGTVSVVLAAWTLASVITASLLLPRLANR